MHLSAIQKILGLLLIAFSLTLIPPMLVSLIYADASLDAFVTAFIIMSGIGVLLWLPKRKAKNELYLRDGFIITAAFWAVLGIIGSLPFLFLVDEITIAEAVFESMSGFTTTGATVLSGLDNMPPSILYYRQQLQWLGGLGIIVLAVAVLPMLGIGGMQLYRAEAPGPMRDEKLTPRLANTAKALLSIYLGLTVVCAFAYWWAGMTVFDAICHSYSTVATGGFSTHDDSLGYYNNVWIEVIAMFFMLMGSLNFAIHYIAWRKLDILTYWRDIQGMVFFAIVAGLILVTVLTLMQTGTYSDFLTALRYASFQVISIISSTGFLTDPDFQNWPLFLPVLILASGFIGGCVGSTTGGMRVIRVILLYKQAAREINRLIHPNAVITVKIGKNKVSDNVAQAVWGFAFLYMTSFVLLSLMMMATGLDHVSAFSGVAATLNMTGPALGKVALSFSEVNSVGLWILSFAMLLGRLEVFTLLVLLSPAFWRH
jgi:trk system potassium uptake protein